MASVTKPFVATSIMQLVEKGKINLDEPVVKYLSYFSLNDKRYLKITVRQMLGHYSGMPDTDEYEWDKPQFNSEEWKNGDYQTRGEMTGSKLFERIDEIKSNSQEQILQMFGKPDAKTKARCCYAGRAGQSGEIDLWLYYIETEDWAKDPNVKPPLVKKALKIYFDGTGVSRNIGDRDSDHDYFPKIGYLRRMEVKIL